MKNELWKDVKGYEGLYQVSNLGRVKSLSRTFTRRNGATFNVRERILTPAYDKKGYPYVILTNIKTPKHYFIHRLVATEFIPNPYNKPHVDHIDCNPSNPHLDNLRWVTSTENHLNPITVERVKKGSSPIGKGLNAVRVVGIDVKSGKTLTFNKIKDTSEYGFDPSAVSKCTLGKSKTHKGFTWHCASNTTNNKNSKTVFLNNNT